MKDKGRTVVATVLYGVSECSIPPSNELTPLFREWDAARAGRKLPLRSDLPFDRLKPWLGHLSLLDPVADGADFVHRLHGTYMAAELHRDLTGKALSELPDDFGTALIPILREALRTGLPTLYLYDPPASFSLITRVNLVLPLGAPDAEGATLLMVAGYPHTILGDHGTAEALNRYAEKGMPKTA